MSRYQAVRGTFDLLPQQLPTWRRLEDAARDLAENYGYSEIRTPLFEEAELFTRGMGVMAGIVERELWTFHDKFGKKLALRADMTTGVVRAFQQHGMGEQSHALVKLYYIAPVFLLGKEGEEGSRQSHQFGVEALGTDSPGLDAEAIALAWSFCNQVGLEDPLLELNSLGGEKCRSLYEDSLRDYFQSHASELCPTCKRKFKVHPTWVLSCEEPRCVALAQVAPTIYGLLSSEARSHFNRVKDYLEDMQIPFQLNPRVIRDLEYYNRTVFQVRCGDKVVAFGGRYDGLVEVLGGKPTPAVGFAISLETVLDLLVDKQDGLAKPEPPTVFLEPEGAEATRVMVPVLQRLRRLGVRAEMSYGNGRGSQPDKRRQAQVLVTLAEANAFRGQATLEDRGSKANEKITVTRLGDRLVAYLGLDEESPRQSQGQERSSRRKLTRKSRKRGGSEAPRRERQAERSAEPQRKSEQRRKTTETADPPRESDDARRRKRRRRRKTEEAGSSQSPPATHDKMEKAFVPALVLGGGEVSEIEPTTSVRARSTSKQKKASTPPPVPELNTGLDWSISIGAASASSQHEEEPQTSDDKGARQRRRRSSRKKSVEETQQ